MATKSRNGQKYNFLTGLIRQVNEAEDEDADEWAEWVGLIREAAGDELLEAVTRVEDRVGKCEQWLAQLQAELDDAEQEDGVFDGEDDDDVDGSDVDTDVGTVQPDLGSSPGRVQGPPGARAEPVQTVTQVGQLSIGRRVTDGANAKGVISKRTRRP